MTIENLNVVPNEPGVYFWLNKNKEIIYIGKAKNLQKRMKQYFLGSLNSYKTHKLVEEISSFNFTTFSSEKEALIFEQLSINKYKPRYNILLLDDKKYPYLKIQLNKKLIIQRAWTYKKEPNTIYYGPLPMGYGLTDLKKYFESKYLYRDGFKIEDASEAYYQQAFEEIKQTLLFRDKKFISELNLNMQDAAAKYNFEQASIFKKMIETVSRIQENQVVELQNYENIDVFSFLVKDGYVVFGVANYRFGTLLNSVTGAIHMILNFEETINSFFNLYYLKNEKTHSILVSSSLKQYSFDIQKDIKFKYPEKGILHSVLKNVESNVNLKADIEINKLNKLESKTIINIDKLTKLLNIKSARDIVMFDNSHLSNTNPVCGMIRIIDGLIYKNEQRHFKLDVNESRQADVEYMRQAVIKFIRMSQDNIPNLIIVDGAIAQLREAKKILDQYSWDCDIIGLVKNDKHKTDHIITAQNKKIFIKDRDLYNFLANIQDEVDKYAKLSHTKKSLQESFESFLLNIDGIGFKTEKRLLEHFGSYSAIYNASEEKLKEVVSESLAHKIKKYVEDL